MVTPIYPKNMLLHYFWINFLEIAIDFLLWEHSAHLPLSFRYIKLLVPLLVISLSNKPIPLFLVPSTTDITFWLWVQSLSFSSCPYPYFQTLNRTWSKKLSLESSFVHHSALPHKVHFSPIPFQDPAKIQAPLPRGRLIASHCIKENSLLCELVGHILVALLIQLPTIYFVLFCLHLYLTFCMYKDYIRQASQQDSESKAFQNRQCSNLHILEAINALSDYW